MNTDLKITELIETIEANAYVSGQNGQMSSKAHTYLRFREVEGMDLRSRFGAYFIDHVIITILSVSFWGFLSGFPSKSYLVIWYVGIKILYFSIQEIYFQSSLGKMLFDVIVVDEYGQKPSVKAILIRSVFRFFPITLILFLDYIVHERFSETLLITKGELKELFELKEKNAKSIEIQDSNYKPETVNQYLALDEKEKLPRGITTKNAGDHFSGEYFYYKTSNWSDINLEEEFKEEDLSNFDFNKKYIVRKDSFFNLTSILLNCVLFAVFVINEQYILLLCFVGFVLIGFLYENTFVPNIEMDKNHFGLSYTFKKQEFINWSNVISAKYEVNSFGEQEGDALIYDFCIKCNFNKSYKFKYKHELDVRELARIFFAFLKHSQKK